MSRELTLSWTPTAADYERAMRVWRHASGASARNRMLGATFMALGFVLTVFVLTVLRSWQLALIPLLGVLGIGVVWYLDLPPRWGLRSLVSRTPAMRQPTTMVVDGRGIRATNPSGTERLDWPRFAAYVEGPDMVLVGLSLDGPAASGILVRSAATTDAAWDSVTRLVRDHVPLHPRIVHLRARRAGKDA